MLALPLAPLCRNGVVWLVPEKKAWMRNFLIKFAWVRVCGDLLWFLIDIARLSQLDKVRLRLDKVKCKQADSQECICFSLTLTIEAGETKLFDFMP